MSTLLDATQVLPLVCDEASESLKVTGVGSSGSVVISATSPIPVTLSGSSNLDVLANYVIDFSDLTTSYFEVDASTSDDFSKIAIYETTGEMIELSVGAASSEVVKIVIGPGNDQVMEVQIPAGSRLAVRTVGTNATAGNLILNFLGAV